MNLTGKKEYFEKIYSPVGTFLYKLRFPANLVTFLSLIMGTASALAYYYGNLIIAMSLLATSGILDLSDGIVARLSGKPTKFGAVFDWIADKWVDGLVLGIVGYFYANPFWAILVVTLTMLHSFIKPVVYAEIGYEVKIKGKIKDPLENVGFFGRPETHLFLIIFTILEKVNAPIGLNYGIKIITLLTLFSLLHRIIYLYKNFGKTYNE
ncbi:MAG: CDP-alcohol phosphatidyltransferase [Thermodesulfobacterium geofontis]|uniref:CDP-alcohol phosphatidyltransferase n=1 Tax=Thermodesulfobacterium geofontis TaxID=1295609 RepID=A0A2N7Q693_9BACT|nr:MAG: CDP-alcohol phosphatidyltransferase [Thermodesulfobacterium geofontis]PMP98179.1 MAG: CDP-alcohol phosphatidyltransferase [Thermodesulfobacterium geofontis]